MARCRLYDEDECVGHDCIDRIGTPCVYDNNMRAGTEDNPVYDEVEEYVFDNDYFDQWDDDPNPYMGTYSED